jgi:hypothetical protein
MYLESIDLTIFFLYLNQDLDLSIKFILKQLTGVPVESRARSQSNLVMHPTSGFSNIDKFSNMTIPMFWAEYVSNLMSFCNNIK